MRRVRRGASLTEVLIGSAAIALAAVLSLPIAGNARTSARTQGSADNLRALANANAGFNADNNDLIASFDWQGAIPEFRNGQRRTPRPYDLGNGLKHLPKNNHEAAQAKQCFILRYETGRDEHHAKPITLDFNVMPQRRFLYLTMLPYLGGAFPKMSQFQRHFSISWPSRSGPRASALICR